MLLQMRLSDDDQRKLVEVEAWYQGVSRSAVMRLALVELHRYVVGAKRRKAEAAVLAEHMPRKAVDVGAAAGKREWTARMEAIRLERKRSGLPPLGYEALMAASQLPVDEVSVDLPDDVTK